MRAKAHQPRVTFAWAVKRSATGPRSAYADWEIVITLPSGDEVIRSGARATRARAIIIMERPHTFSGPRWAVEGIRRGLADAERAAAYRSRKRNDRLEASEHFAWPEDGQFTATVVAIKNADAPLDRLGGSR